MARLPKLAKKPVSCIDVHYQVTCPGVAKDATGVGKILDDGTNCDARDAVELTLRRNCKIDDVRV